MSAPETLGAGQEIPSLSIPLTRALIVATALATRDYQDVHHDPDAARASGAEDVFMNILTSNAMVERYLRAWAGDDMRLRALKIRLGVPNAAGDTLTLTGRVASVDSDADGTTAEVEVRGTNSLGLHISGSATLRWPEGDAR